MNAKKTLGYVAITAILLTGGFFIYKYFSTKPVIGKPIPTPMPPNPPIVNPTNNTEDGFPLKLGSKNDYVKQLQDELGVIVDGIFGSKTLAALKEQTGKSQIQSYDELQSVIDQILQQDAASLETDSRAKRSNDILDEAFNTSPSDILVLKDTVWKLYNYDTVSNQYVKSNMILNFKKNQKLNLNDYQPFSVMNDGYLVVNCTRGVNSGYWRVDPSDITLQ